MLEQSTAVRILVEAQDLIQRRGFFGLSLQDLADRLSIRKPSLYAHYDSKARLGEAMVEAFEREFKEFAESGAIGSPAEKLNAFLVRFEKNIETGRVSLHSALGLDGPELPALIRDAYLRYRDLEISWLSGVLEEGKGAGDFHFKTTSESAASILVQELMGAELMSRITGSAKPFLDARVEMIQTLKCSH